MAEGSACLFLEELEHAKARGAKIYGEIAGSGMSADAHHITASHPEGLGAKLVMQAALTDANMQPEDIDYINVHGTSTHVGDISEVKAIKELFGEQAYKLNISSTKSMTGHMLGAAGAALGHAAVRKAASKRRQQQEPQSGQNVAPQNVPASEWDKKMDSCILNGCMLVVVAAIIMFFVWCCS